MTYSQLYFRGFPGGASGKEPACPCRRHQRQGFGPGVGSVPERTISLDSTHKSFYFLAY